MFFGNSLFSVILPSFWVWRFIGIMPCQLITGPDGKKRFRISLTLYIYTIVIAFGMITYYIVFFPSHLFDNDNGFQVKYQSENYS